MYIYEQKTMSDLTNFRKFIYFIRSVMYIYIKFTHLIVDSFDSGDNQWKASTKRFLLQE